MSEASASVHHFSENIKQGYNKPGQRRKPFKERPPFEHGWEFVMFVKCVSLNDTTNLLSHLHLHIWQTLLSEAFFSFTFDQFLLSLRIEPMSSALLPFFTV